MNLYIFVELYINIGKNNINDASLKIITDNIKDKQTLNELILEENKITKDGMIHLASILATLPNLGLLNIGKNNIGDAGVENFKNAFKTSSIVRLHVHECGLSATGVQELFNSLPQNTIVFNASI